MGMTQGLRATIVAHTAPAQLRGTAFGFFNLLRGIVTLVSSVMQAGFGTVSVRPPPSMPVQCFVPSPSRYFCSARRRTLPKPAELGIAQRRRPKASRCESRLAKKRLHGTFERVRKRPLLSRRRGQLLRVATAGCTEWRCSGGPFDNSFSIIPPQVSTRRHPLCARRKADRSQLRAPTAAGDPRTARAASVCAACQRPYAAIR